MPAELPRRRLRRSKTVGPQNKPRRLKQIHGKRSYLSFLSSHFLRLRQLRRLQFLPHYPALRRPLSCRCHLPRLPRLRFNLLMRSTNSSNSSSKNFLICKRTTRVARPARTKHPFLLKMEASLGHGCRWRSRSLKMEKKILVGGASSALPTFRWKLLE